MSRAVCGGGPRRGLGDAQPVGESPDLAYYRTKPDYELVSLLHNINEKMAGPRYPALLWAIKERVESNEAAQPLGNQGTNIDVER